MDAKSLPPSLPVLPRLKPGTALNGRYLVDAFVRFSSYCEVYRGRDQLNGRPVMVRVISQALLQEATVRSRLGQEMQAASKLEHKNIGKLFGLYGATVDREPVAYLACEFVDGQTLREMIDRKRAAGRTFSLRATYNIIAHVCNALSYAHATTVHGALSPDAVMVNEAGRVKLIDFGLGRTFCLLDQLHLQIESGELSAMAPEVVNTPQQVDKRADVYSVGVILFELITGRPPSDSFLRPSSLSPEVTPALDTVIETALRPQPHERYADTQLLKEALRAALAVDGGVGPVTPPPITGSGPKHVPATVSASIASAKAGAMLSSREDQIECWLVRKDNLDFGPFCMSDLRSQVETGALKANHVLSNTETKEKMAVREHPQLRQLALEAEARFSERADREAELADRSRQRQRVVGLLAATFLVVIAAATGITWYVLHMTPRTEQVIVHDTSSDLDFLKGVQITMKVDPPPPKAHKPGGKHNGRGNNYSDVTNLGDATSGAGDETLDQTQVQQVMSQNFRLLVGCVSEERRRNAGLHAVDMDFVITGAGSVQGVRVNGSSSTAFAGCMFAKMKSINFPKFNGSKTHASFSLALR